MKTLKITSLALLMIAISLVAIPVSTAGGDNDRYRDDSSSVFAPGYINAAKHQAEAAIKEQTPKKSFMEKAAEYVQSKTTAKVEKSTKENSVIVPKLKGPRGGGKANAHTQDNAQTITTTQLQDKWKKYGDATGDGKIDSNDLARVLANYNQKGSNLIGDFNEDGIVDITDLTKVLNNYNQDLTSYGIAHYAEVTVTTTIPASNSVTRTSDNTPYYADPYNTSSQSDYMTSRLHDSGKAKTDASSLSGKTAPAKTEVNVPAKSALSPPVNAMAYKGAELKDGMNRYADASTHVKSLTDDQKAMIDVAKTILTETSKLKDKEGSGATDLKKAQDNLLQAIANILLAQAVPDLLKSGDVSNIKAMFQELDQTRAKIMLDYSTATKPYYENMIKDMAKNMAILQGKNLLNPNMTKEELSKLPPSELDKILEKIKNMPNKSFEEEYLLQQEAKYRHDYLDPNNKKLESDMKGMLNNFTGRIGEVLKNAEKK